MNIGKYRSFKVMSLACAACIWGAAPTSQAAQSRQETLRPVALQAVTQDDQGFHLVDHVALPNPQDVIVMPVTATQRATETVVKQDDFNTALKVTATTGTFFFRTDRTTQYYAGLVASFPHYGTWTYFSQLDGGSRITDACVVEKSQTESLHLFLLPKLNQNLTGGMHRLELSIPGPGRIEAIILSRKPLTVHKVKAAPQAKTLAPAQGEVRFVTLNPVGATGYQRILADQQGAITWSRMVGTKRQTIEAPDNLRQISGKLELVATLTRDKAGKSAVLGRPRIEYNVSEQHVAKLGNDQIAITVDRRTGRMGRIVNVKTGQTLRSRAELPFRLLRWDTDKKELDALDPDRFECTSVRQDGNQLTLAYKDTQATGGPRTVQFNVKLHGAQLDFSMQVHNGADTNIRLVHFPYLSDMQVGDNGRDDKIAWAGRYIGPVTELPAFLKTYNTPATMFADVYDDKGAFYLAAHDATGEADRMLMTLAVGQPPYTYTIAANHEILPGKDWTSQTHVLAVHEGDWHKGADIYRAWYATTPQERHDPDWLKYQYTGALNIAITTGDTFGSLADKWREAKWRGSTYLKVNNVGGDGFVNNFFPAPNPYCGGEPVLRKTVNWIRDHGGQLDLYMNCRYYSPAYSEGSLIGYTPRWMFSPDLWVPDRQWTLNNAIVNLDGTIFGGDFGYHMPFQPFYNMSFRSKGWYDYWDHWMTYYAKIGMNVYWDESMLSTYRDDLPVDRRKWPDLNYQQGLMRTAQETFAHARQYKKDFVVCGEGFSDRMMRYVNMPWLMNYIGVSPIIPYTFPDMVLNQTVFRGDEYEQRTDDGFLYQLRIIGGTGWGKGWGTDMRRVTQLRTITSDVTHRGRYMDNVGLTGERPPSALARYTVLDQGDRQVICVNTLNKAGAENWRLSLRWPLKQPPKYAFAYVRGNEVKALPFDYKQGTLEFTAPTQRMSSILFVAREDADHQLRADAFVPMNEPGTPVLRLALSNATDHRIQGVAKLQQHDGLSIEPGELSYDLAPGQAIVLNMALNGTGQLTDFTEAKLILNNKDGSSRTAIAQVAPILPNWKFEDDVIGDHVADFWTEGNRTLLDDGSYCLVVPGKGNYNRRGRAEATMYLRPGTKYQVKFRYKATASSFITVFERDNRAKELKSHRVSVPAGKTWKEQEFTFSTTDKTDAGFSLFSAATGKNQRDGIWLDDVRCRIIGTADAQPATQQAK